MDDKEGTTPEEGQEGASSGKPVSEDKKLSERAWEIRKGGEGIIIDEGPPPPKDTFEPADTPSEPAPSDDAGQSGGDAEQSSS